MTYAHAHTHTHTQKTCGCWPKRLFLQEKERTPATSPASSVRVASPSFSASPVRSASPSATIPIPPESSPRAQSPPPPPLSRGPSPTASLNLSQNIGSSTISRVQSQTPKAPYVTSQAPPAPPAPQLTRSTSSIPPSAPRLPLPARTLEVPEEKVATNSLPFMPHDLSGSRPSVAPLGAAPGPAHPSDRWCLPCDDGKLLVLRSTESAEQQEMTAYWRAQARGQLDVPRFPENSLMGSVTSREPSPTGSRAEHDGPDPALLELAQRVDRMKLEKCQSEIQGDFLLQIRERRLRNDSLRFWNDSMTNVFIPFCHLLEAVAGLLSVFGVLFSSETLVW